MHATAISVYGQPVRESDASLSAGDAVRESEGQMLSSNAWEAFFTPDGLRPPEAHEVQFGLSELVLS